MYEGEWEDGENGMVDYADKSEKILYEIQVPVGPMLGGFLHSHVPSPGALIFQGRL